MTSPRRALALALLLLSLSLCACSKRGPAALPVQKEQPTQSESPVETPTEEPETSNTFQLDLPLGLALGRQLRRVEAVTISAPDQEEALFETQDPVLAQSLYDALHLQGQVEGESTQYPYEVRFTDSQGEERLLALSLDWSGEEPAQVREGEETWSLPQADSIWLRNQLRGID